MSFLVGLFGFTKLPPWALELLAIAGVGLGIWLYHLHVVHTAIKQGIDQQLAADDKATKKLKTEVDKETAQKLVVAQKAAADANQELDDIKRYVAAHAQRGSVCDRPTTYHRGPGVPEGGPGHEGTASTGPAPSVVQPVQPGDPGSSGYSQRELLTALAAVCDRTSATLREEQAVRSHQ